MKNKLASRFPSINSRLSLPLLLLAFLRDGTLDDEEQQIPSENYGVKFGQSYHNDLSPALRDLPAIWPPRSLKNEELHEANLNPQLPLPLQVDAPDPVVDHGLLGQLAPEAMP